MKPRSPSRRWTALGLLRPLARTSSQRAGCVWVCLSALLPLGCDKCSAPPPSPNESKAPKDIWLEGVGTGPEQTARVCASGRRDRVTAALCQTPPPRVDSIEALYAALDFVKDEDRSVATTTQSSGLSAHYVSAANPRTLVFVNPYHHDPPVPYEKLAVVAFARGEQLVEMVALDTVTFDWNFYLLSYRQACNASRCTPEQLLTEQVERNWTDWTLYADADLEDTPLDCLSCHTPFGRGTHRMLLMREFSDPWMHWGDFRGVYENADCSQDVTRDVPGRHLPGDGLDLLVALETPDGRHAGIPVTQLNAARSGRDLSRFVIDAENTILQSPREPSDYPYDQLELTTSRVLCERAKTGESATWNEYRRQMRSRGLPVAFYAADVLDPRHRADLLADRAGLLARHSEKDAVTVAASWLSAEAIQAAGFLPDESSTAPEILRHMCVRCHDSNAPPGSNRSGFDATKLEQLSAVTAQEIRYRIHLPHNSAKRMPPPRAGELTDAAIERIGKYLTEHCADPSPGACE